MLSRLASHRRRFVAGVFLIALLPACEQVLGLDAFKESGATGSGGATSSGTSMTSGTMSTTSTMSTTTTSTGSSTICVLGSAVLGSCVLK